MSKLSSQQFQHRWNEEAKGIALFIAAIWVIYGADRFLPLEQWGLIPRDPGGLAGIITMPFLHADFSHLMGNTIPLVVLLLLLAGSRANSRMIVLLLVLTGGALLWLFGREALHIGASGLVFGLIVFLIATGLLERRPASLSVSAIVALLYGGSLVGGIMPFQKGVSWDGHLLGAIAGVLVAVMFQWADRKLETLEEAA